MFVGKFAPEPAGYRNQNHSQKREQERNSQVVVNPMRAHPHAKVKAYRKDNQGDDVQSRVPVCNSFYAGVFDTKPVDDAGYSGCNCAKTSHRQHGFRNQVKTGVAPKTKNHVAEKRRGPESDRKWNQNRVDGMPTNAGLACHGEFLLFERKRIARIAKLNDRHSVPAWRTRQGLIKKFFASSQRCFVRSSRTAFGQTALARKMILDFPGRFLPNKRRQLHRRCSGYSLDRTKVS